ncbi:medium-chain fatty acid-CoA ligase faa2 [Coemansia nantahalensis]|nr:medium-chain fatty acid-CoA ligase faa2 [Coemansia nantahalensis]
MQSFQVPSSESPGYSAIYRHPEYKDGTQGGAYSHVETIYDLLVHATGTHPTRDFIGTRSVSFPDGAPSFGEYEWLSGAEAFEYIAELGSGLDHVFEKHAPADAASGAQQPLGIFAINRAEWLLAEFAAFRSRRYTVGICDTVSVEIAEHTVNHADIEVIVCSLDKVPRMIERRDTMPGLKVIVSMDRLDCSQKNIFSHALSAAAVGALRDKARALGIELTDIDAVRELGRASPTPPTLPAPSDLGVVTYTSGTTGAQKGVMLTHAALVYAARSYALMFNFTDSTYLSYVPLMHSFDRCAIHMIMLGQTRIGFYSGDTANLLDDARVLQPTFMIVIPLLLNRIYERLVSATVGAGGLTGFLSRAGFRAKVQSARMGQGPRHALWDRLVFGKIAALFGGRLQSLACGAAPVSDKVLEFFRVCLSCDVLQGYGQTECAVSGVLQLPGDQTLGHMGVPPPGIDIRLRSRPDMDYLVTDTPCPRGELQIRGANVFAGYMKEPQLAQQTMDGEWLATGDIVRLNPDGTVTHIDRTKSILKTGRAVWVAPERVEAAYTAHPLVRTIFVHGAMDQTDLVAIVVPEADRFLPWARRIARKDKNAPEPTLAALCADADVVDALLRELNAHAVKSGLTEPEVVGALHCDPEPFESRPTEFYTSTYKLVRRSVLQHYSAAIERMFARPGTSTEPSDSTLLATQLAT